MWDFIETVAGHRKRNPLNQEFFDSPDSLTDISALVRESIQNSLDARLDADQPVVVRFRISESSPKKLSPVFSGLDSHLESALGSNISNVLGTTCRYLVVEDFNCTGLTGRTDTDSPDPKIEGDKQSYTYFVHFEGESGKGSGKGGKWGVGKIVFPKLSKIRTFFIDSWRESKDAPDDNKHIALAQAITRIHKIDGKEYVPDGWMAERAQSGIFEPLQQSGLDAIEDAFELSRSGLPGLSIVIPYIAQSINIEAIKDAAVRQYFVPIIMGDLVCVFSNLDGSETRLDKSTISTHTAALEKAAIANRMDRTVDEMLPAIQLVFDKCEGITETISLDIEQNDILSRRPTLDIESFVTPAKDLFDSGKSIEIKVSLPVPLPGRQDNQIDEFSILLKKVPDLRGAPIYSREGIIVANRRISTPNAASIVLVTSGRLADLLGSAEGPAHMDWSDGTDKFKKDYEGNLLAALTVPFIKTLPAKIIESLNSQSGSFDENLLKDLFPIPNPGTPMPPVDPPIDPPVDPPIDPPVVNPTSNPELVYVSAIANGFSVQPGSKSSIKKGTVLKIRMAYQVKRGNPFNKYSLFDFDAATLSARAANVALLHRVNNEAYIQVHDAKFEFRIWGFDPIRDLEVSVTKSALTEVPK
jgi:hypothetical protein